MSGLSIGGGLDNLGNTCFFNATLQSILHTRALATILTQHLHSSSCRLSQLHQWCCFCELETVFAATRHAKRYSPSKMIKNLKSIFKKVTLTTRSLNWGANRTPISSSDTSLKECRMPKPARLSKMGKRVKKVPVRRTDRPCRGVSVVRGCSVCSAQ